MNILIRLSFYRSSTTHILIDDILKINNIVIEDKEAFGKVCDIFIEFLDLIQILKIFINFFTFVFLFILRKYYILNINYIVCKIFINL